MSQINGVFVQFCRVCSFFVFLKSGQQACSTKADLWGSASICAVDHHKCLCSFDLLCSTFASYFEVSVQQCRAYCLWPRKRFAHNYLVMRTRFVPVTLRAVSRRAFKTSEQLAASETARWKMARLRLGWHERKPTATPSPGLCTQPVPMAETRPRTTATGKTAGVAAAAAVEADTDDKVEVDSRPRKRAVVRVNRKEKVGF